MNSPEFVIYMMVIAIFSMMWVCCRLYCRHACKDEREDSNDDNSDCEGCCGCNDHFLANPSHARAPATNTWQPPALQQLRQVTNFGTLSTEPNTLSFYNRVNFEETLATATILAQGSSNFQAPLEIANAPPRYDFMNAPSVPHPYNAPSESHIYNIPSIPAAVNSGNADDPPPDYASVVLGDLLQGNEHTQFPMVRQDK